jgi:hypothetical protein
MYVTSWISSDTLSGDLLSPRLAAMMLLESASRSLLLALVRWEPTAGFGGRRTLIGLQLDQHDPVSPNFSRLGRPIAIGYWNEGWGELENLPPRLLSTSGMAALTRTQSQAAPFVQA